MYLMKSCKVTCINWVAISRQPSGVLVSASQSLLATWAYTAPGVAWVILAVVTIPTCHWSRVSHVTWYWPVIGHLFAGLVAKIGNAGHTGNIGHCWLTNIIWGSHIQTFNKWLDYIIETRFISITGFSNLFRLDRLIRNCQKLDYTTFIFSILRLN